MLTHRRAGQRVLSPSFPGLLLPHWLSLARCGDRVLYCFFPSAGQELSPELEPLPLLSISGGLARFLWEPPKAHRKCVHLPERESEGQVREMAWDRRSSWDGAQTGRLTGKGQGVERPEESTNSQENG